MFARSLVALVVAAVLMACGHWVSWMGEGEPSTPAPAKRAAARPPGPKITISRETTFVTGPLRPDGSVDYLAAINERYSKGVTPDNNAAVPLLQVLYSVGPNGKDDGGRNWSLESNPNLLKDQQPKIPQDADDYFIRVPPKGE
jgi:hypothetical protein